MRELSSALMPRGQQGKPCTLVVVSACRADDGCAPLRVIRGPASRSASLIRDQRAQRGDRCFSVRERSRALRRCRCLHLPPARREGHIGGFRHA